MSNIQENEYDVDNAADAQEWCDKIDRYISDATHSIGKLCWALDAAKENIESTTKLAKVFVLAKGKDGAHAQIKAALANLANTIASVSGELVDMYAEDEVTGGINIGNKCAYAQTTTSVKINDDDKARIADVLRACGAGDLVKSNVNVKTLASYVGEHKRKGVVIADDGSNVFEAYDIDADLAQCITVKRFTQILVRKS